jgi:hypothetical protein
MTNPTETEPAASRTKIIFDLHDELTPEEIARFQENATSAGAKSLTEHFLNLTLRVASNLADEKTA